MASDDDKLKQEAQATPTNPWSGLGLAGDYLNRGRNIIRAATAPAQEGDTTPASTQFGNIANAAAAKPAPTDYPPAWQGPPLPQGMPPGGAPVATDADITKDEEKPKPVSAGGSGKPRTDPYHTFANTLLGLSEESRGYSEDKVANELFKKELLEKGEAKYTEARSKADADKVRYDQEDASTLARIQKESDTRYNEILAETQAARNIKVDPQHWFKEKGTGGTILAALAMGAGAFGAAMPHTGSHQNFAMDIIDKAIDRDVSAQQSAIDNQWKGISAKVGLSKDKFASDSYLAHKTNELHIASYEHAISMAEEIKKHTNNQVSINNINDVITNLREKQLESKKADAELRLNVAKHDAAMQGGGGPTIKQLREYRSKERARLEGLPRYKGATEDQLDMAADKSTADHFGIKVPKGAFASLGSFSGAGGSEKKGEEALASVVQQGRALVKDPLRIYAGIPGAGSPLGQRVNPNVAKSANDLDTYNNSTLPAIMRVIGERMPHEDIVALTNKLRLAAGDTPQEADNKVNRTQDLYFQAFGIRKDRDVEPNDEQLK